MFSRRTLRTATFVGSACAATLSLTMSLHGLALAGDVVSRGGNDKVSTVMKAKGGDDHADAKSKGETKWKTAVAPKPLSREVRRGLDWLAERQLPNGGWGQGEESANMGSSMDAYKDKGNVADTCMATLALIRAGSTPSSGPHAKTIQRALDFVLKEVEASDNDSLYVTGVRGTRVQSKIGPYVDTFLSSVLFAEIKGKMPTQKDEQRLAVALDRVLYKMQKHQTTDGGWSGQAWAPALSGALGRKGLNRAAQAGADVDDTALARAEDNAQSKFDGKTGSFSGGGNAGVNLYSAADSIGSMGDSENTLLSMEEEIRADAKSSDKKKRAFAQQKLARLEKIRDTRKQAGEAIQRRVKDPSFISGFGSNGGEEFLSYMLISESLVAKGGKEWKEWDNAMTANLSRVQNGDGSWTGHHCITGRTFVTSAALLVLTADRAPMPVAEKLKRG